MIISTEIYMHLGRAYAWDAKANNTIIKVIIIFNHQLNDRDSVIDQYKILKKLNSELANKLFNEIYK